MVPTEHMFHPHQLSRIHKACYSCGLSTAGIEYSCLSVCLSVCVHDNSKNNGSINLKLEHIVVYENISDEFDQGQGHGVTLKFFSITAIQTVKAHISSLAHVRKL